jgi:glycosyltransferase involved in cell wall biosynthesis
VDPGPGPSTGADPLVSVVIPAYNGVEFLGEALDSILQQGWEPIEILVVDDGSTDDTAAVARSFGDVVRYEQQPHQGCPAAGRNRGVQMSRGPLVAFLDQDDLWPPGKLKLQVAGLRARPSPGVVIGRTQVVHVGRGPGGERGPETFGRVLAYRMVSAALFTRQALATVGPFDETLRYYGDDLEWFIRARDRGVEIQTMDAVSLYWRLHGRNTSDRCIRDHAAGRDHALTEVIKRTLDRRRRAVPPRGDA